MPQEVETLDEVAVKRVWIQLFQKATDLIRVDYLWAVYVQGSLLLETIGLDLESLRGLDI